MSDKIDRRSFLSLVPTFISLPLLHSEASAQVRGMRILSPIEGYAYTYFGPMECFVRYKPRHTQNAPRIARVRYIANGIERGFGLPGPDPNRNFYFNWFMPVPPLQGIDYTMIAEALNSHGQVIGASFPVQFRVNQLPN